jgi:pimeloyl-ACP methyl ester carboxylesterase
MVRLPRHPNDFHHITGRIMSLEIPQPVEEFDLTMDDGAVIRIRRHGDAEAPVRLFLSNGNGFAIDGYLPFWGPLGDRFDLIVFDQRNHGRNPLGDPPNHDYAHMARDLETVFTGVGDHLGGKINVGAFHSMSGRAAMKHATEIGWRWDALVLFDPPNIPLKGHKVYDLMCKFEYRLDEWAKSRRAHYGDPSELAAEYAGLRAHAGWAEGAHELMARSVLRRDADAGGWSLVFPGALEGETYLSNIPMNLWPSASEYGGPVMLVGADPDVERPGPTAIANKALAEEGGYRYEIIRGAGHMLQLEKPEACRNALISFLDDIGVD